MNKRILAAILCVLLSNLCANAETVRFAHQKHFPP